MELLTARLRELADAAWANGATVALHKSRVGLTLSKTFIGVAFFLSF